MNVINDKIITKNSSRIRKIKELEREVGGMSETLNKKMKPILDWNATIEKFILEECERDNGGHGDIRIPHINSNVKSLLEAHDLMGKFIDRQFRIFDQNVRIKGMEIQKLKNEGAPNVAHATKN